MVYLDLNRAPIYDQLMEPEPILEQHPKPTNPTPIKKSAYKEHKKKPFLEAYAKCGTIWQAARAVGISRDSVHDWRKTDQEFATAFDEADIEVTDELEQCAIRRAKSKSDVLLIFLLKNRAPERYGDDKWKQMGEQLAQLMTSKLVGAVRKIVPEYCPSCRTHLDTTHKIAEEMGHIANELAP